MKGRGAGGGHAHSVWLHGVSDRAFSRDRCVGGWLRTSHYNKIERIHQGGSAAVCDAHPLPLPPSNPPPPPPFQLGRLEVGRRWCGGNSGAVEGGVGEVFNQQWY